MRRLLAILATLAVMFSLTPTRIARAIDLTTAFGSGAPAAGFLAGNCQLQANHAGALTSNSVIITANGSDSAVISLICNGASVTLQLPTISVNGRSIANVAFPQTVTSSAQGMWQVQAGPLNFTIIAQ